MSRRDDEQAPERLGVEDTVAVAGAGDPGPDVGLQETVSADGPATIDVAAAATVASAPGTGGASGALSGGGPTLAKGDSLGRYLVVETLGAGGMGVVYKGYDPELHRQVALKLLRPRAGTGTGGDARARLQREAQAMAQLSHPNILTVYDVGLWQGQVYVAMELVDGVTLHAWLGGAERSTDEVLDVFRQAGAGLATAHGAGLVHRDFKPDNVLVGRDGRVRVMDFGLARHVSEDEASPARSDGPGPSRAPVDGPTALETPLTQAGALLGTPAYMSPEQFRGEGVDARSDQFAFGVALYEAIYGCRPFSGGTLGALERAVTEGRRDPLPADRAAPTWLRGVLDRALATAPGERFRDMDALLEALAAGRRRKRRVVLGVTAAVAAVLAVAIGIFVQQRAARTARDRARLQREGRERAARLASTQSALKKQRAELTDTEKKLRASKEHKRKLARHFAYLKGRRAELLKALVEAPDKARREELSCQIAGLEDVIAVGGDKPLVAALRATFRRCFPVFSRCYQLALADDPKRAGTVKIRFHTDETGKVIRLEFVADTVGHRGMLACLRDKLLTWRLPNGGERRLQITYPFYFKPDTPARPRARPAPGRGRPAPRPAP